MTIPKFVEKAVEGGWGANQQAQFYFDLDKGLRAQIGDSLFLDPLAWKAVGKVEGWGNTCDACGYVPRGRGWLLSSPAICPECRKGHPQDGWLYRMHRMIDVLAEGKTIEQYLETL